jgi:predicted enzyme related to lactoylglutathione lyase
MSEHGTFYWNELMTRDAQKAKDFYAKTLGWSYDEMDMGNGETYAVCMNNGKPAGGIMRITEEMGPIPEHWFSYIAVDDVDKRLEKLKAEGGKVVREPFDVPGVGRIAIVQDPGGAAQGWMKPAENA